MHARLAFTVAVGAGIMCSAAAQAADNTRYISITGNNANACTLAMPCRTLAKAIGVTPAGGEIQILDSGFFGVNATIRKSLTISGNGHTVYLDNPITVSDADAVVALRGLTLDGLGTVTNGISIDAADAVHIERCVIHGFTQSGINASATGVALFVLDSISRDNTNGLLINGASRLTIDNSRFENNSNHGVSVSTAVGTIHRSTTSGNGSNGFSLFAASVSILSAVAAQNGASGFSVQGGAVTVESSLAHDNFTGLSVFGSGTARISNSTFTGNGTGIHNLGSTLETRQNNTVKGNATDVNGALTVLPAV
jgi:hypothetical protein